MKFPNIRYFAITTLISLLALTACASSDASFTNSLEMAEPAMAPAMEYDEAMALEEDMMAREMALDAGNLSAPQIVMDRSEVASQISAGEVQTQAQSQRIVIYSANVGLVVADTELAMSEITKLANDLGGFVISSELSDSYYGSGESATTLKRGSISIRVDAEQLDAALAALRELSVSVNYENRQGQDVTSEYTDLSSRLRNLENTEAQLTLIMEGAQRTEDVLAVHRELNNIRGQIEVIQGQLNYYEESARLSSITIDLQPDYDAAPIEIGGWSPGATVRDAIQGLIDGLQVLGDVLIYVAICGLPILVLIGIPGWYLWRWRKNKKAANATTPNID